MHCVARYWAPGRGSINNHGPHPTRIRGYSPIQAKSHLSPLLLAQDAPSASDHLDAWPACTSSHGRDLESPNLDEVKPSSAATLQESQSLVAGLLLVLARPPRAFGAESAGSNRQIYRLFATWRKLAGVSTSNLSSSDSNTHQYSRESILSLHLLRLCRSVLTRKSLWTYIVIPKRG